MRKRIFAALTVSGAGWSDGAGLAIHRRLEMLHGQAILAYVVMKLSAPIKRQIAVPSVLRETGAGAKRQRSEHRHKTEISPGHHVPPPDDKDSVLAPSLYPKAGMTTLMIVIMPGSMTAANIAGKIQVTKGKVSLTGSLCAISSARSMR